jgi:hypothetical protein
MATTRARRKEEKAKAQRGRPRKDAAAAKALSLAAGGMTIEDAGAEAKVSPRTMRRAREKAPTVPSAETPPASAEPVEPVELDPDPLATLRRSQAQIQALITGLRGSKQIVQLRQLHEALLRIATEHEKMRQARGAEGGETPEARAGKMVDKARDKAIGRLVGLVEEAEAP